MMERTDRHCRYLLRLTAPDTWLYTEMITAAALAHGDPERLLKFDVSEHPVAAQLGGADPGLLAAAAKLAAARGYDEINLNVGCPSSRVQAGAFGAALMLDPGLVAECVVAMREAVGVPVTVKTRLGVDDHDSYELLAAFTGKVVGAGCRTLVVHARKAWLEGLSPKENREIPPLDYDRVHRLKRDFPAVEIVINGGFTTAEDAVAQLAFVDGVMLGRSAYRNPMMLAELERRVLGRNAAPARADVLARYLDYMERELVDGTPLRAMTRHLAGLFAHRPGGGRWRQALASLPDGYGGLERLRELAGAVTQDRRKLPRSRYNVDPSVTINVSR